MNFRRIPVMIVLLIFALTISILPARAQDDTQQIVSLDESLTLTYPNGWYALNSVSGLAYLVVSNDERILESGAGDIIVESGQVYLLVVSPAINWILFETHDPLTTLDDAETAFRVAFAADQDAGTLVETALDLEVAGYPARRLDYENDQSQGAFVLIDAEGTILLTAIVGAPGEFASVEADLLAILNTLTFDADAMLEYIPFTDSAGVLTFEHPVDWAAVEFVPNSVLLLTTLNFFELQYNPGDLVAVVAYGEVGLRSYGVTSDASLAEIANAAAADALEGEENSTIAAPEGVMVNGQSALRVNFETEQAEGFALVTYIGDEIVVLVAIVTKGELTGHEADFQHLIESLALTVLE